jgi:hypothetical protein
MCVEVPNLEVTAMMFHRNYSANYAKKCFTKMAAFFAVAPCSVVEFPSFSEVLAAPIIRAIMALSVIMDAAGNSETSVSVYQTTRNISSEESHFFTNAALCNSYLNKIFYRHAFNFDLHYTIHLSKPKLV